MKVLIKPHVSVESQGWAGDFAPDNEADWQRREQTDTQYVLALGDLAESTKACFSGNGSMTTLKRVDRKTMIIPLSVNQ